MKEIAEAITNQILLSDKMRPVVNEIAAEPGKLIRNSIIESVKNTINRTHILERRGNESSSAAVERVLNDNNFKSTAMKDYQRFVTTARGREAMNPEAVMQQGHGMNNGHQ